MNANGDGQDTLTALLQGIQWVISEVKRKNHITKPRKLKSIINFSVGIEETSPKLDALVKSFNILF
jgi:hypothetical protein